MFVERRLSEFGIDDKAQSQLRGPVHPKIIGEGNTPELANFEAANWIAGYKKTKQLGNMP